MHLFNGEKGITFPFGNKEIYIWIYIEEMVPCTLAQ